MMNTVDGLENATATHKGATHAKNRTPREFDKKFDIPRIH